MDKSQELETPAGTGAAVGAWLASVRERVGDCWSCRASYWGGGRPGVGERKCGHRLTQAELSKRIGLSQPAVSRALRNTQLRLELALRIAHAVELELPMLGAHTAAPIATHARATSTAPARRMRKAHAVELGRRRKGVRRG